MTLNNFDLVSDVSDNIAASVNGGYPLGTFNPSPIWGWNNLLYPNRGYETVTSIGNINAYPTHPNFFAIQVHNITNTRDFVSDFLSRIGG